MEWYTLGVIMFASLLFLLMLGIPVGFSLLITSVGSLLIVGKGVKYFVDLPCYFFHHLNSFTLTCVTLFILMALYAQFSGFGSDLFRSLYRWVGKVPGSLNITAIMSCAIFSAISGTSVATAATVGLVAMPEFKRYKYNAQLAVGSMAAGGALGILIPPSVPMIMYCVITGQSIGHMFAGGLFPGLMTAGIFMVYIFIRCKMNPALAPIPEGKMSEITDLSIGRSIINVVPIVIIILAVLLSIYLGIATPTEAAAVGAFGAGALALLVRRMNFIDLFKASIEAVRIGAFIILIFLGALAFGHAVARGGVAVGMSEWVVALGVGKYTVLVMLLSVLFFLGFFMDPTPIILTTMPIIYPLAMQFGFDPVYFGVLCVMTLETAAITPPVGFNLFILRGIGQGYVSMGQIIKGSFPFVLLYILCIIIVLLIPDIIMYLPNKMMT